MTGSSRRSPTRSIRPCDRGLLEAIEAQSTRLAVPMAVRADPGLRGVRFAAQIEATAWYVLAEALSSVEKHVNAIFTKLGLSAEQFSHLRVTAVLTFLRDAGLRG